MPEWLRLAWGALWLDRLALYHFSLRRRALGEGMALLVGVWLLVALAGLLTTRVDPTPPWERTAQMLDRAHYYLERTPLPIGTQRMLEQSLALGLDLQAELNGLPRPFGPPADAALAGLTRLFAIPYGRWGAWLVYSLCVLGLLRALGGRASLTGLLGAMGLSALPHLLEIPGLLLGWGPLLGPFASGWGALIYLRAVRATSDLDRPQALLVVLLPGVLLFTLALLLLAGACVL